jgi:hypothetical protein
MKNQLLNLRLNLFCTFINHGHEKYFFSPKILNSTALKIKLHMTWITTSVDFL